MKLKAQKIPRKKTSLDDVIARFCYYFPQYTFADAKKKLPYRRVMQMLRVAEKERAAFLFELTNIAAAPHTKKGQGVKKLLDIYRKIFE